MLRTASSMEWGTPGSLFFDEQFVFEPLALDHVVQHKQTHRGSLSLLVSRSTLYAPQSHIFVV